MGAILDALHRLQEIELQIAEVRQQIERKQRAAKAEGKRLADLDAKIHNKEAALRTDEIEANRLEVDVKAYETQIAKLRQALNLAKTNKEYSAVLTQLNTIKADSSKVEERVLGMFNQLEAKRKDIEAMRQERAAEAAKLETLEKAVRDVEDASRDNLTKLTQEREQAAESVPAKALDVFNRIAKANDGEAMAKLVRTHPRRAEYACGGCHMSVTIEQVNSILSRDDPVPCGTCGRIMYMKAPATAQAAAKAETTKG
jgi:uncharacterized protein